MWEFGDRVGRRGAAASGGGACVPRADGKLGHGVVGQLQLAAAEPRPAVLVPDTAIVTDGARRVVYVSGAKDVVQARPVTLGPVIDGLRVVRKGLTAQDRVVVGGIQRAMPGDRKSVV